MTAGAIRFCRYAYAPNALGYCGPPDAQAVLRHGAAGEATPDLDGLARGFEGAWPYLGLIADANGVADPLDDRVVEAYWVGNELLDAVSVAALSRFVEERFTPVVGRGWTELSATDVGGSVPHHNFHVFSVYPWVGMLRLGRTVEPIHVLDSCRVRWGIVERVEGATAVVRSRPLTYDGQALSLGEPRIELPTVAVDGQGFVSDLGPGDWVSMHWSWVCERLDPPAVAAIEQNTSRAIDTANRALRRPGTSR